MNKNELNRLVQQLADKAHEDQRQSGSLPERHLRQPPIPNDGDADDAENES